jgi:hypothetical protein
VDFDIFAVKSSTSVARCPVHKLRRPGIGCWDKFEEIKQLVDKCQVVPKLSKVLYFDNLPMTVLAHCMVF